MCWPQTLRVVRADLPVPLVPAILCRPHCPQIRVPRLSPPAAEPRPIESGPSSQRVRRPPRTHTNTTQKHKQATENRLTAAEHPKEKKKSRARRQQADQTLSSCDRHWGSERASCAAPAWPPLQNPPHSWVSPPMAPLLKTGRARWTISSRGVGGGGTPRTDSRGPPPSARFTG